MPAGEEQKTKPADDTKQPADVDMKDGSSGPSAPSSVDASKKEKEKTLEEMSEEDRKLKESLELLVTVITEPTEKGKEVTHTQTDRGRGEREPCAHCALRSRV